MLPRERVMAALRFEAPDVIPLRAQPTDGGLYEHGEKLLSLFRQCGHDFGPLDNLVLPPAPLAGDYDANGRYYSVRTDGWGTTWEHRIPGIWGHPLVRPLDNLSRLPTFKAPPSPPMSGPEFDTLKAATARDKEKYFTLAWAGGIFEKMFSLRNFENVLMEIMEDTPEINRIADLITGHVITCVNQGLAVGADGISFGDDFGTQQAMIFSLPVWRRFFKPRFKAMMDPIKKSGKAIFLHSCGQITPLLEDFAELGIKAIWPQLPVFDLSDLARRCRSLGISVELHPDRGDLMQRGTPAQIRDYIRRMIDTFDSAGGGSWLYLEIDPGFPWENIQALFQIAMELRSKG